MNATKRPALVVRVAVDARRSLSVLSSALLLVACSSEGGAESVVVEASPEAKLVLEWAIGNRIDSDPEYQFASIGSLLPTEEGTVWVADGADRGHTPSIRQFDANGSFIRQVGRQGMGPGEHLAPQGLAELADGRVVARDAGLPGRLTVFNPDGSLDATWSLGGPYKWPNRGRDPIQVDDSGVVWIPFRPGGRPGPSRPAPLFLRISPAGDVIDTVPIPPVPEVEREDLTVTSPTAGGGIRTRGVSVPFQPRGAWAWDPQGSFAVARTDRYRIELHAPGAYRVVTRDVPPVFIDERHRDAAVSRIRQELYRLDGGEDLTIPDLPEQKPILKGIDYTLDGRLIVHVSTPSILRDGEWIEDPAFDVFSREGVFEGRLLLTDSLLLSDQLLRVRGDHLWTVHEDESDVQSIRQFRVLWPGHAERQAGPTMPP